MSSANDHRAAALLVATALHAGTAAGSPATDSPAADALELDGRYAITSRTVMPHLEEMRRITATETRCLKRPQPGALFPVLRQRALLGCALTPAATAGPGVYRLRCASDLVATGDAIVAVDGTQVEGDLHVKMGGKNMTFAQFVSVERAGDCVPGDSVTAVP
jgi:hypothetical protein